MGTVTVARRSCNRDRQHAACVVARVARTREPLEEALLRARDVAIDWLEITPENHVARGPHADRTLAMLAERFPAARSTRRASCAG